MIKNLDRLNAKLSVMGIEMEDMLIKSVGREIKNVTADARLRCPVHNGELRRSITDNVEIYDDRVMGVSYTNKEYGTYVEFGTGPNGEAHHEGISPAVTPAYSQTGWMIPAAAMSREEAEEYGFGVVERAGEVIGYRTNGQAAQPFMYPALKNQEKKIKKNIQKDIKKGLGR